VPENLPSPLYARKLMRRAARAPTTEYRVPTAPRPYRIRLDDETFEASGPSCSDCVALARSCGVDRARAPCIATASEKDRIE